MPQKTRKEKVAAQERKRYQYTILESVPKKSDSVTTTLPTEKQKISEPVKHLVSLNQEDESIKKYFLQDFKKSLLLIVAVLALEIFLYFARINHILI
jgi:hypothetical protein